MHSVFFILSTNYLESNMLYIYLCKRYMQNNNPHTRTPLPETLPHLDPQHNIYQPPYGSSSSVPTAAALASISLFSASRANLALDSALARCS
jgi:hypothetical protein